MNCLSVFEHFVRLALKGLSTFHLKKWVHCPEMSGALRDLVPFVQFKKRENRSVTFNNVAGFPAFGLNTERYRTPLRIQPEYLKVCNFTESNTTPWVFFTFFNCTKWYLIAQSITMSGVTRVKTRCWYSWALLIKLLFLSWNWTCELFWGIAAINFELRNFFW